MCVDHRLVCKCGKKDASITFRDEVLPPETVASLYCPECSGGVSYDSEKMVKDNGWVLDFDMEIVRLMSHKLPNAPITPAFIFDEGYCTWRGVYPGDHSDSARERKELSDLAAVDKKRYLDEFRKWSIGRMDRLAQEGWRKAISQG